LRARAVHALACFSMTRMLSAHRLVTASKGCGSQDQVECRSATLHSDSTRPRRRLPRLADPARARARLHQLEVPRLQAVRGRGLQHLLQRYRRCGQAEHQRHGQLPPGLRGARACDSAHPMTQPDVNTQCSHSGPRRPCMPSGSLQHAGSARAKGPRPGRAEREAAPARARCCLPGDPPACRHCKQRTATAARRPLLVPSGPGSARGCVEARTSLSVRMRSCSAGASAPSTPATTTTSGRSAAGRSRRSSLPAAKPACDRHGPGSCPHVSAWRTDLPSLRALVRRGRASCERTAKQVAPMARHAATRRPLGYALVDHVVHARWSGTFCPPELRRAHRRIRIARRAHGARAAPAPARLPLTVSVAVDRLDDVQPAPGGRRAQPHPLQRRCQAGRRQIAVLRICAGRAATAATAARPRRRPSLPGSLGLTVAAAVCGCSACAAALTRRRARRAWADRGTRPGRSRGRSTGTGVGAGQPGRPGVLEAPRLWAAMRRRGGRAAGHRAAGRRAAPGARRAQAQRAQRSRVRGGEAVERVLGVRH